MKINQALIQIALKEGISVAEVRKEIQTAIDAGLNNPDPKIQEYWAKIPKKGKKHTPDEVIAFLAKEVKKNQDIAETETE